MASSLTSLEQDLTCAVCQDIYKEPLLLLCTHSFCRACLERSWAERGAKECPLCRKRSSLEYPPVNRALENACETFLQEKNRKASAQSQGLLCPQHAEKLDFFCVDDQTLVCVECVSQEHQMHNLWSTKKAATGRKDQLRAPLEGFKKKLTEISSTKSEFRKMSVQIQSQAQQTENQIKVEFEKLHQFLREEEKARITALRVEEEGKKLKMRENILLLTILERDLSSTIRRITGYLRSDDVYFLLNIKDAEQSSRAQETVQNIEMDSEALIDVAKHLGNLKYNVWEKMKDICPYFPVTLNPNSASNTLTLSEDLNMVTHGTWQDLPNNPERFSVQPLVLGSEGFSSGIHSWEVEVGNSTDWLIGVVGESVKRKYKIQNIPQNGIWAISCLNGQYSFDLNNFITCQRIKVQLDWLARQVRFYDSGSNQLLHSFVVLPTQKIYPLFDVSNYSSLKILPAEVSIKHTEAISTGSAFSFSGRPALSHGFTLGGGLFFGK